MMKRAALRHRRGFTLVEVLVCGTLSTMLAVLLSTTWRGLGRPVVDAMASARIVQEAQLAATSLARDFGGSLAESAGRLGGPTDLQWVGRMQPGGTELRLCFDGTGFNGLPEWGTPDTVIRYFVDDGKLIRWNETTDTMFVVANLVEEMEVVDLGSAVQIRITFSYRNLTRAYTFVGVDP